MALIVQKFGGTSVADTARIKNAANLVAREVQRGNKVVVVVSAMSGVTNQLVAFTKEVSNLYEIGDLEEQDAAVASGEQVTSALMALALRSKGLHAHSYQGWQIPVITDKSFSKARIKTIKSDEIHKRLDSGEVVVVPGFQGVTADNRITTLGRGGSDTSAVALAAALKADRCDIYTDVDGVYTCDPRIVPKARKLEKITYEEMLEMASQGAKVLQTRSVEMAMNYKVKLQVLSSFADVPGTMLVDEEEIVESQRVTGLAYNRDEARVTLVSVPNVPGVASNIFLPLAKASINVDMIVQNVTEGGKETDMTFTVGKGDLARAMAILKDPANGIGFKGVTTDTNVSKISVIGVGMRSHAGVAAEMFQALSQKGINLLVISTSEIKISVLIDDSFTELALRTLHSVYGLDAIAEKV